MSSTIILFISSRVLIVLRFSRLTPARSSLSFGLLRLRKANGPEGAAAFTVSPSLSLAVTEEEFYEVEDSFVANLCFVLEIPPHRLRIVNVVAGRRRSRHLREDPLLLDRANGTAERDDNSAASSAAVVPVWPTERGSRPPGVSRHGHGRELNTDGVTVDFEIEPNPIVQLAQSSTISIPENSSAFIVVTREVNPEGNVSLAYTVLTGAGSGKSALVEGVDFVAGNCSSATISNNAIANATNVTSDNATGHALAACGLQFAPHESEKLIEVRALHDGVIELGQPKQLVLKLSSVENGDLGERAIARVQILNVDAPMPPPPQLVAVTHDAISLNWEPQWVPPASAEILRWELQRVEGAVATAAVFNESAPGIVAL